MRGAIHKKAQRMEGQMSGKTYPTGGQTVVR